MKRISLLLINTLTLIFALVMNSLQGSEVFNGTTVGEVSAKYETLFTPAGYAFAIWGIIYLLLILFVTYQWFVWFKRKEDRELKQISWWFAVGNLANGLWVVAWLNEQMGLSVLLILILLFSLIQLTIRLRLEIWDAPLRIIAFVWWPVCIYLGWVIVATVANISVFLVSIGWQGGFLQEQVWTIIMIVAATTIYLLLIKTRNMREAAVVGIWALVAIAVKQWQLNIEIVIAALTASAILFVTVAVHGFRNRKTSPFEKLKRGEV
ncbi:MAG: hypothetical protein V2I31_10225 [Mariniphaga sp.]|nr:hypothetical protein [Mariniphaga sp.]